jgi:hypothetical protein
LHCYYDHSHVPDEFFPNQPWFTSDFSSDHQPEDMLDMIISMDFATNDALCPGCLPAFLLGGAGNKKNPQYQTI